MTLENCLSTYLNSSDDRRAAGPSSFPYFTSGDRWKSLSSTDWDDWITGFWTGIHWIANDSGVIDKSEAIELTQQIEPIYEHNFNTGFRFQYSWVPAYEITRNPRYKRKALKGAERLSRCYDPDLSVVGNRDDDCNTILTANDALMNIPLLLWAITQTQNSREYRSYIEQFLEKATQIFVKPNGSVRHRIHYNPDTLTIERVDSPQGVAGGCWSRGLAWTVYGLTLGGLFLDNEEFTATAKTVMNYHRENSYELVPPFDYSISTLNKPSLTDTSAGAIMASAMLTLGKLKNDKQAEELGARITEKLFKDYRREKQQDGLIDGGCFHYPEGVGVNEATVWGDFYALEALYIMENDELPSHLNWLQATHRTRAKAS